MFKAICKFGLEGIVSKKLGAPYKSGCKLGLEGIVSKKLGAPYKSGPSRAWLKIKNPKAPAATRAIDGTF
jgi:ATP-dependent DNA ligase